MCESLPDHRPRFPRPCRLIAYRQWLLAYRIAGVLKSIPGAAPSTNAGPAGGAAGGTALAPAAAAASVISQDAVLVQWACAKISASAAAAMDDAQLKVRHRGTVLQAYGCCETYYR